MAHPFTINIDQSVLDDLQNRLAKTRWPDQVEGAGWDYGTNLEYLQTLVSYWQNSFDWRKQEAMLNQFTQFRADVGDMGIHYIHERGKGPNPLPLLLTHGWPDSFFRMYKLIPRLTHPEQFDGKAEDAFDVIVPSIPGYGFSGKPTQRGFGTGQVADCFAQLMTNILGYTKFGAHGGDWGSSITEQLARQHADSLVGIHLTDIPYYHLFSVPPGDLSPAEQKYLEAGKQWQMTEGAYAMIQSTKPQTLAYGLNDSPVGELAWIIEKFRSWSDSGGDIERRFTNDELLTNAMIYWVTQTVNSASRIYYEAQANPPKADNGRVEVPTGVAIFPADMIPAPREFAERIFNVQHWTQLPRGGHFAALEEPDLLAEDIRAFFRPLRVNHSSHIKSLVL